MDKKTYNRPKSMKMYEKRAKKEFFSIKHDLARSCFQLGSEEAAAPLMSVAAPLWF